MGLLQLRVVTHLERLLYFQSEPYRQRHRSNVADNQCKWALSHVPIAIHMICRYDKIKFVYYGTEISRGRNIVCFALYRLQNSLSLKITMVKVVFHNNI